MSDKYYKITQEGLRKILSGLIKEYKLIAPIDTGQDIVFDIVADESDIVLDYSNTVKPPKEFFIPQKESIIKFDKKPKSIIDNEKKILFGIRPCDLAGLVTMDNTFKESFEDPHYLMRRKNTLIIAYGCTVICDENAFCKSMDAGPIAKDHYDLQVLKNDKDGYHVLIGSEDGRKLITDNHKHFESCAEPIYDEVIFTESVNHEKLTVKLDSMFNDEDFWRNASETCIRCAGCNYLCPSCFCYNIVDTSRERLRCWDSCMLRGFTREASSHIPRKELYTRFRQRMYHKYDWHKKRYNVNMCTGCGRCVTYCPGLIPYIKIINNICENE